MIRVPRPRFSIYGQLVFWTSLIILLIMSGVLYIIQEREIKSIYQEKKDRGLLMARYISEMNLRRLILWDLESIDENISGLIRDDLAYVIFYDGDGRPVVVSESVADNPEVINRTSCAGDVSPGEVFIKNFKVALRGSSLEVMEIEVPVFVPGSDKKWGSVKIGLKLEDVYRRIQQTRMLLLGFGLGAFLLTLLATNIMARKLTRPIKNLVEGTRRLSRGDFSYRIPVVSSNEIGDLTRSFNEMAEELARAREKMEEANRRLVQAEKLASIGRLSATIAHEIRNPLTSVKLNIQKLAELSNLGETEKEHLEIARAGIEQIEKFIKDLLSYTRVSTLQKDYFSLEEIMEESIKMLQGSLKEKEIRVKKFYKAGLPPAYVDADRLRQVFLNVLRNAYEAVDHGGEIEVSVELNRQDDRCCFEIRISDDGCGIPEKDWENIFEPFFTTKSSGAGLGLANARRIIEQHGGSIRVIPKEGPGSCFLITLPLEEIGQEDLT